MHLVAHGGIDIPTLSRLTARAPLYERTAHFIWTDDHVGREMLKFHLDPDLDSASLKHATIDRQVAWIAGRVGAATPRDLLDLGCGPGLYCERFRGHGFRVTGLDFNPHSLRHASERATRERLPITYLHGNYVHLDYREHFDVITLINKDFGALVPAERDTVLAAVHRALRPGGRFVFDTLSMVWFRRLQEVSRFRVCAGAGF